MKAIEYGSSAYRRTMLGMLLGSLVTFAILYSPQTLLSTLSNQFQIPPSTSSLVISVATVTLAVSMLVLSVCSNAWGRKKMMGASLLLASLLNLLAAFSPNFETLIVLRILQGVAMGGFPAIAMTYLSEEVSKAHIGRIMGIYVGGSAVGAFVGRIMVSTLTDFFNWHSAMAVLGVFSLCCSILFWYCLPESSHFNKASLSFHNWANGITSGLKNRNLLKLYLMAFLLLGAYVALFNYIGFPLSKPPYHLTQTMIGFLFVFQLVGSWSSYVSGKLTERYSRSLLMSVALLTTLAGALLTLAGHIVLLSLGLLLFASGFLAAHTVASGWVGVIASPAARAYASSLYLLFYYTGSSMLGWSGGFFLSRWGWSGVVVMIGLLLLAAGGLLVLLSRSLRFAATADDSKDKGDPSHESRFVGNEGHHSDRHLGTRYR